MAETNMTEKNVGIEALRIVSMLFVCLLHVLYIGGVLNSVQPGTPYFWISWFLECAAYCGVNCYALISGYVGYSSKFKLSRLAQLWLQVIFYELLITLCFQIVNPSMVYAEIWLRAVSPVLHGEYWYITAYFGMFFFIPLMNSALKNLDRRLLSLLLTAMFVLFCLLQSFTESVDLGLRNGYATLWLCALYLAGGYVKKYDVCASTKKWPLLLIYAAAVALTWITKMSDFGRFLQYNSATVTIASLAIFVFFTGLEIKTPLLRRVIIALASASLGVYLIHTQPLVFGILLNGFAVRFLDRTPAVSAALIILSALGIYLACSLIDLARIKVFKLLRINKATQHLDLLLAEKENGGGAK